MKKQILNILAIIAISAVVVTCKDKAKEAETGEAEMAVMADGDSVKYIAQTEASSIEWKGFKPTGTHNGNIMVESGVLMVNDGKIESGSFLIDMNSIQDLDMPADDKMNAKLVGHLKSADFFDVEKYPSAAFEVTGFEEKEGVTMLSGNLTLKEKKNNVTFPVTVANEGDVVTLTSESFTIDRSKWDVKYGSKSFFDDLGDKFINDDIELKIMIKAKKS